MPSYNRVILAGNLTRDPQLRMLSNEQAVASFALAVNRRYKNRDGEQQEEVTFVDCEAWGRTAELVGQYLTKGRACLVEGRLKLDSWEDKDGTRRSKLKVVADAVQFLDGKSSGGGDPAAGPGSEPQRATTTPPPPESMDDEPPF